MAIVVFCALPARAEYSPDLTARVLAGRPADGLAEEHRPAAMKHARTVGPNWQQYERMVGKPMAHWAAEHLDRTNGETVFYPFGGPDFATVQRLYPTAGRYVLIGLEHPGRPVDLASQSAPYFEAILRVFRRAIADFTKLGFFVSKRIRRYRRKPFIEGISGILMLLASQEGYVVEEVRPVRVSTAGAVEDDPDQTWTGVRLLLRRKAGDPAVLLDYFELNLHDINLKANAGHRTFVQRMAHHRVFLKAAAHLLQRKSGFSTIRDSLLAKAKTILQDETGLGYEQLDQRFDVRLMGRFERAHHVFGVAQAPLRDAYEQLGQTEPIPFRLGYRKATGPCLQYAHTRR